MGKKSKKGQSRAGKGRPGTGKAKAKKKTTDGHKHVTDGSTTPSEPVASVQNAAVPDHDPNTTSTPTKSTVASTTTETISQAKDDEKDAVVEKKGGMPAGLESSLSLLTPAQQDLVKSLCSPELNQAHLFEHWPKPAAVSSPSADATNNIKRKFVEQLESMDKAYPSGGLAGYIHNARDLLKKSKMGVNPLEGWKPSVPEGQTFQIGTDDFASVESSGVTDLGSVGFVLVAGGLGERLGYSGIKIGLPTEMTTETMYLQYYIEYILALQQRYAKNGTKLPLCIMTSGDTNTGTVKLLSEKNYFGMEKSQVTIVIQGEGVPALEDNDARIALDPSSRYKLLAKPHGHGDIHALLYTHQVAKTWLKKGIQWLIFFQDTNGLAFHTLPLAIGVSKKLDLVMNSVTTPRRAKQAIGAITKLENEKTGETRTLNVEYNQLDPLLRSSGYPNGDVNDKTGFSPFPGNINQLLFKLKPYADTLEKTKGVMPEFVNPKYKDVEKTIFKKPTRLECMMQDFPTVLAGDLAKKVGFTSIPADLCFSPVKNATSDGVALQKKGTHPGTAASGEADQYCAVRNIMRSIGCQVEDAKAETYNGIKVVPGPAVVFKADFCAFPAEYKTKFTNPSAVKISGRSTLVVKGSGIKIESLDLDGALVIECEDGASGLIKDLVVKNSGWRRVPEKSSESEVIAMRGYRLDKTETRSIVFKKDGTIEGDYSPTSGAVSEKQVVSEAFAQRGLNVTEPSTEEAAQDQENDCKCAACVIL